MRGSTGSLRLLAAVLCVPCVTAGQGPARLGAGLSEDLRIGSLDGDTPTQFSRITVVRAHHGTGEIFVANQGTFSIRVFAPTGRFVREFGRQGSGPGEFQSITAIAFAGDTVLVNDVRLLRVSAFRSAGEFMTSWPANAPDRPARRFLVAITPGGWLVSESSPPPETWTPGANIASATRYLRIPAPRAGTPLPTAAADSVVVVPARETIAIASPMATTAGAAPFAPVPAAAVDAGGNVYVHRGLPYVITVHGPNGGMVRRIAPPHTARQVTRAMLGQIERRVRTYHDTLSRRNAEYPMARAADFGRLELRSPATLPPLGRMIVAPDGAVWVERIDLAPDPVAREWGSAWRGPAQALPTLWDRFDGAGGALRQVELPARFTPMSATADSIIGVQRDEDGVEFVVRLLVQ